MEGIGEVKGGRREEFRVSHMKGGGVESQQIERKKSFGKKRVYPELSLRIEEIGDYFTVELRHSPPITPPIITVTDLERRLLEVLLENPAASSSNLAQELSMTRDTVKEYLGRLKKKELLVREGSARAGRWVVTGAGKGLLGELVSHGKQQ